MVIKAPPRAGRTSKPPPKRKTCERGYDYQWSKVRLAVLTEAAWRCQRCLAKGKLTEAQHVHHKVPIHVDPSLRLEVDNLEALCVPCHEAEHK